MKINMKFRSMIPFGVLLVLIALGILYIIEYDFLYKLVAILTAIGGIFSIFFEFQRTKKMAEAQFVTNLNHTFNTTEPIIKLYNRLEKYYRNIGGEELFDDVEISDYVIYFTFFETLYTLIQKNIIGIAKIHDLFAYRFFIIVHNPVIQKNELEPYDFSYANIFALYEKWFTYAYKEEQKKIKKKTKPKVIKERIKLRRKQKNVAYQELGEFIVMKENYLKQVVRDIHV